MDEFLVWVGDVDWREINEDRALLPCEGDPSEPCYPWLLACTAFDAGFETRSQGRHLPHGRVVLAG
jgi:hypothetical protein